MTDVGGFTIHRRMTARNTTEPHRVSSPLELLFDLTFVVAVAQLVVQLAHGIEDGHAAEAVGPFLMVFFAIWWAWMNFTWFASAYDTDDVPYRLLTMLQMGGVLVLAAGVPTAFAEQDFRAITLGYLIMRIGLVAQWVRAGFEHPESRATAWRYAAGVSLVQLGWLARLALPEDLGLVSFVLLVILDLAVPFWAERTAATSWHPHHISERYGLFTIILLGESVLAATIGVRQALAEGGVSAGLLLVSAAALVTLFALWWLYFLERGRGWPATGAGPTCGVTATTACSPRWPGSARAWRSPWPQPAIPSTLRRWRWPTPSPCRWEATWCCSGRCTRCWGPGHRSGPW
jgi:low temperature requirement protein LtrA